MEKLTVTIKFYIYRNGSNGYSVIKTKEGNTITGELPEFTEGTKLLLEGRWTNHNKYGQQFQIEKYEQLESMDGVNYISFLSSGLIDGIGYKTASKIFELYKEDSIDILLTSLEKILDVSGIGSQKFNKIKLSIGENQKIIQAGSFLIPLGLASFQVKKIFDDFQDKTEEIICSNPYRLIHEFWGINFKKADEIAAKLGFNIFDDNRVKSGLVHVISEYSRNGNCFIIRKELLSRANYLLNVEIEQIETFLKELGDSSFLIVEKEKVYLPELFYAERGIEDIINQFLLPPEKLSKYQKEVLKGFEKEYSSEQIFAMQESLANKLIIITGGPGTGKTQTVKGIATIFKKLGKTILLTAPTGRAAKRMEEIIGEEAKTIHRLLEYNPRENYFNINRDNQLKTDLLVVDEVSMIDTQLMFNLLTGVDEGTTIVLVGDSEQLPSVGPGTVLQDLIESDIIPIVRLNKIFRQSSESKIIIAAHDIRNGHIPDIKQKSDSDLIFIEEANEEAALAKIVSLVANLLPDQYGLNPIFDIQVLSPMYRGELGIDNLNKVLQNSLNKSDTVFNAGVQKFKLNDKVLQLKNNYGKSIYNGDIGIIDSIENQNQKINISFDHKITPYDFDEADEFQLAYCISIHKSQGSEFPCVILPLSKNHKIMMQRNLIYTGITRAQKLLVIVGSKQTFDYSIKNVKAEKRLTSLFKFPKK